MKAIIWNWADTRSENYGYAQGQEIPEEDVFSVASELFAQGLNVMIYHGKDRVILYVDSKKFGQR